MSLSLDHKIYGSVTVNAKWQIVIPSEARTHLGIKPGDQLVVTSKGQFVIGLIKADNMSEFITAIEQEHPECFSRIHDGVQDLKRHASSQKKK